MGPQRLSTTIALFEDAGKEEVIDTPVAAVFVARAAGCPD